MRMKEKLLNSYRLSKLLTYVYYIKAVFDSSVGCHHLRPLLLKVEEDK